MKLKHLLFVVLCVIAQYGFGQMTVTPGTVIKIDSSSNLYVQSDFITSSNSVLVNYGQLFAEKDFKINGSYIGKGAIILAGQNSDQDIYCTQPIHTLILDKAVQGQVWLLNDLKIDHILDFKQENNHLNANTHTIALDSGTVVLNGSQLSNIITQAPGKVSFYTSSTHNWVPISYSALVVDYQPISVVDLNGNSRKIEVQTTDCSSLFQNAIRRGWAVHYTDSTLSDEQFQLGWLSGAELLGFDYNSCGIAYQDNATWQLPNYGPSLIADTYFAQRSIAQSKANIDLYVVSNGFTSTQELEVNNLLMILNNNAGAFLKINTVAAANGQLAVYNNLGQLITKQSILANSCHEIPLSNYNTNPGVYYAVISLQNQTFTKKFIVY